MKRDIINNKLIDYRSFFWTPDYVDVSAWIEHIPFAFWIIEVLQPKSLVELGVHNGTSYFAFCQAIKTLNINAVCYGVDTWQGDDHAGFYGDEVFPKVTDHNTKEFSRFSTLIKSTFDEAREYFLDGSTDLLHIDGLHTYEAVKHDFDAWLPKMSNRGVVILHDINVRERNFGVFKLWEELKEKYPSFQFDFGHGLGIVAIGEIAGEELKELFSKDKSEGSFTFLTNYFSERGNFFKAAFNNSLILKQEKASRNGLEEVNVKLNESYKSLESLHAQLNESQTSLVLANNQLQAKIGALESEIRQLQADHKQLGADHKEFERNNERLREQYAILESINTQLKEKHQNDTADLVRQLKIADSSFGDISYELTALKKEIEAYKKNVTWYKNTYEDRSILGVLKEKLKGLSKKKINNGVSGGYNPKKSGGRNSYHLNAVNDLRLSDKGVYETTGSDPFFLVDFKDRQIRKGWYWLSIGITIDRGVLLAQKLYCDYGRGFNENDVWNLPEAEHNEIKGPVRFQDDIKKLRFDPSTIDCVFGVRELHLVPLGKIGMLRVAFSKYKKIHFPSDNGFTVFGDLTTTFFKTGIKGVKDKLWEALNYTEDKTWDRYRNWCKLYDTISEEQLGMIKTLSDGLAYKPLFSIVMPVYNVPVNFLKKAIESVEKQTYGNWEFCIADDKSTNKDVIALLKEYQNKDPRIKVVFRETNGRISKASNSALALATGDYMVLLDGDDELTPHALYMVAKTINENRNLELIYSDEDKIDEEGNRYEPYFKTDWNIDLFYGQNMINHLGVYKLSLIKKAGDFRHEYEGSQDYDLALRCLEHIKADQIRHIPHILYHWRAIKGSAAFSMDNKSPIIERGLNALNDHLTRTRQHAVAMGNINNSYRVKWRLPDPKPLVSIIIPTKDKSEVLSLCITSILEKTKYENFEILVIDNDSGDPVTLEYLKTIQKDHQQVKVYSYKSEFNFSAIVNYGVCQSKAEAVVLLNNDTEVINDDWLQEMVSQCMREDIGAVGAKLYYPNGQIQHAGVFLYEGHPGNHIYLKKEKNDPGYFNKLNLVQDYSVVTAACLAIRRELYLKVGGLDEKNLKVAYNDVDFCLKVREAGYRNLWTPFAQLIHHESLSRGSDMDEGNYGRFKKEQGFMLNKWEDAISNDPYFNPNLGHDTRTNDIAFPPRISYEWQDK